MTHQSNRELARQHLVSKIMRRHRRYTAAGPVKPRSVGLEELARGVESRDAVVVVYEDGVNATFEVVARDRTQDRT